MSGQRAAKRSERSEDGTPAARDPPEGRAEKAPRQRENLLGRGTPRSFFHSPPGIREPDCETYMSSRSEVIVIWRW